MRSVPAGARAATFEMQNRYFPLGSCGIASTSSTSCRIAGPNVSRTSSAICRRLASPNAVVRHQPDAQVVTALLHDLHLGRPGDEQGEVLRQRDAGDQRRRPG